ncbi:hypothetical protein Ait01nite_013000 [Actinoplanes italicus]|uniref:Uncharacterized protein DUF1877 n=1 Tax=Actinoplanes italicus TaxID=113567 RepID=A0A2T0KH16_9ACTN|nr:DUF1877 family protein [Actinoplanes italicus]PRX22732.1 uncharacterized protein DUF1877 [Actinoplanes italicus]GIE28255.1 hypothetical protein Ait01nite_013000 [Actinoplanes italicus]
MLGVHFAITREQERALLAADEAGDDTDFEYTWANFVDLRDFFQRAATAGRSVLFTAT